MVTDGRYSVAFPRRWWYPACRTVELGRRPIGVTLMGSPVVVFRDGAGRARALIDRCPHRNVPLSLGRVNADGCLECAYHGWRFDGGGRCTAIPGLLTATLPPSPNRDVSTHATEERDGFVWLWGEPDASPAGQPFALPELGGPGSGEVVFARDLECTLHASLENVLDVLHTAFLHRGSFRGTGEPNEITAERRETPGGVEVQFVGEPVGLGRIQLGARSALTFDHWDRFFLPSIAQIEYRVAGWLRITNNILHLPLEPFRTRAWFVVRWWSRLPRLVARPIVFARGVQLLRQDASILARQSEHLRRFGGERYTSTELDLMGNAIWRLLRQAERAETGEADEADPRVLADGPARRSVTFRA